MACPYFEEQSNAPSLQISSCLSFKNFYNPRAKADLAQLVEQLSCKQQVTGSNPVVGSMSSAWTL